MSLYIEGANCIVCGANEGDLWTDQKEIYCATHLPHDGDQFKIKRVRRI